MMDWTETAPGTWEADGYFILEEGPLAPTLEEALEMRTVYSWKAPGMLYRDMQSHLTLDEAKAAAEAHASTLTPTGSV